MHDPHHSRVLHVACESRRKEECGIGHNTEMKHHKQKHPVESLPRLPDANDRLATVAVDQPPRPDDRVLHPALPHLHAEPSEMETNLPRNVQRRRKLPDASETGTSMNSSRNGNGRREPPGFRGVRR